MVYIIKLLLVPSVNLLKNLRYIYWCKLLSRVWTSYFLNVWFCWSKVYNHKIILKIVLYWSLISLLVTSDDKYQFSTFNFFYYFSLWFVVNIKYKLKLMFQPRTFFFLVGGANKIPKSSNICGLPNDPSSTHFWTTSCRTGDVTLYTLL